MTEKITRVKNKIIREFTHMRVAMKSWYVLWVRSLSDECFLQAWYWNKNDI